MKGWRFFPEERVPDAGRSVQSIKVIACPDGTDLNFGTE